MQTPTVFRPAPPRSAFSNVLWLAAQCAVVWSVTLFILPLMIISVEHRLGSGPVWWLHSPPAGVTLFVLASALNLAAGLGLSVRGQGTPLPVMAPRRLVLGGPYRYVRNPMAIAGISQGVAVAVWFGSWVVLVYALMGAAVWHFGIRPVEEQDLVERFGDPYARYRSEVPLWWPRTPGTGASE